MRHHRDKITRLHRCAWIAALPIALCACSPAVNWRVIDLNATGVSVLLPCKPEAGQRDVPLQDMVEVMDMRSCELHGVTYTVAWTRLPHPEQGAEAIRRWWGASAHSAQADMTGELQVWPLTHATAAWRWQGAGLNAQRQPIDVALAYALVGPVAIQMAVYSPQGEAPDRAAFWAGLSLPRR